MSVAAKKWIRFTSSILICTLVFAIGSAAADIWIPLGQRAPADGCRVEVVKTSPAGVKVAVDVPGYFSLPVPAPDGKVYQQVSIPGCGSTAESEGRPELPFKGFFLEIPPGLAFAVETESSAPVSLATGVRVFPRQPALPDDDSVREMPFEIDEAAYASDRFFPARPVTVGHPAFIRGRRVVLVQVHPLRYNPVKQELQGFATLRVHVKFQGAPDPAGLERRNRLATRQSEDLARRLILNYQPVGDAGEPRAQSARDDGADYLIIVADDLVNQISPLEQWKYRKGFLTHTVQFSDVGSTPEDIKTYIQNAYETWDPAPSFVLLVGDSEDIPPDYYEGEFSCYTDHPYACVDGDDYLPDLTIGRLPTHTTIQCANVVDKIMQYDHAPVGTQWYHSFLSAAYFEDGLSGTAQRWFMETSATAFDFVVDEQGYAGHTAWAPKFWADEYHFSPFSYPHREDLNEIRWGVRPYPDPVPAWVVNNWTSEAQATADISTAINAGVGLIQHRDHGRPTQWSHPPYTIADINALTNGDMTPVVFSINCQTGAFYRFGGDCFCEAFLKKYPGGAVGVVGATRTSYSGFNDLLVHGMYTCFWPDYDTSYDDATYPYSWRPAEALNYGKYYMLTFMGEEPETPGEFHMFHWFGDPEMMLRTTDPVALAASFPQQVVWQASIDFIVEVSRGGVPVENALVCISHESGADHWTGYTNAGGSVTFNSIVFSTLEDYDIVATEQNSIPFEGTVSVVLTPILVDIGANLPGLMYSALAWGDYDKDNDLDLAIAGYDGANYTGCIYRNDGGTFSDISAPLVGMRYCSLAWGDYDHDGDLDLAMAGQTAPGSNATKIYRNDGMSGFTDIGVGIVGVGHTGGQCALAWGDYDNDGELDLALAGAWYDGSLRYVCSIYRNYGADTFLDIEAGLVGVDNCALAWADYDNDGDLDLVVAGDDGTYKRANLYRNNGNDEFDSVGTGLVGVDQCSLVWGDYDNDGNLDLALAGVTGTGDYISRVYRNTGSTLTDAGASMTGMRNASLAWGDCDNDGDVDLALSGRDSFGTRHTKIYRNDGGGSFADMDASLTGVAYGSLAWGDYDNDNDLDLALSGHTGSAYVAKIYRTDVGIANDMPSSPTGLSISPAENRVTFHWQPAEDSRTPAAGLSYNIRMGTLPDDDNVFPGMSNTVSGWRRVAALGNAQKRLSWTVNDLAAGTYYWSVQAVDASYCGSSWAPTESVEVESALFTDIGLPFGGLEYSAIAWGDYDNDGDLDLAATGYTGTEPVSKVYRNLGGDLFEDTGVSLTGVDHGAVAWADFDNDGDLDLALAGRNDADERVTIVYRNMGTWFSNIGADITGLRDSSLAWGDFDNDGDADLAIAGFGDAGYATEIYRNTDGTGFSASVISLAGVKFCSLAWGDYDNDSDLDLAVTGYAGDGVRISRIYRNNNGTSFTDIGAGLPGLMYSALAWSDYDNDGDLDLALAGTDATVRMTKVFRNDGGDQFTDIGADMVGLSTCSLVWGDYDNDGDQDLATAGYDGSDEVTRVYRNDGGGSFFDIGVAITPVRYCSLAWGDYDEDGHLDLAVMGRAAVGDRRFEIYHNNWDVPNAAPNAPSNLSADVTGDAVTFGWTAADDDHTPPGGLTYNLRVGTSPGDDDVFSGMADLSTGLRRLPAMGNAQKCLSWTLEGFSMGTYYWSVQAIDTAFVASGWAGEESVVVSAFTDMGPNWVGLTAATFAWGDYDNDDDLDVVVAGSDDASEIIARVYRNDGDAVFTDVSAGLTGVRDAAAAWGDYDNDGDLDLVLAGYSGSGSITTLYRNDGDDVFIEVDAGFTGVGRLASSCSLAWGDYNNDGRLDLALAGEIQPGMPICKVYRNDGSNSFTDIGAALTGVEDCALAWGDYDNDQDLDLIVSGYELSAPGTNLYRNDGADVFTAVPTTLPGLHQGAVAWGDCNYDGNLDLALSGNTGADSFLTAVYLGDGAGGFVDLGASLLGVQYSSVSWGDYDNDGDLDLAVAGRAWSGTRYTTIYDNHHATFTDTGEPLPGVSHGVVAWGDYDNDDDLDLALTGYSTGGRLGNVYRNNEESANTNPTSPPGLATGVSERTITMSWQAASDSETPADGLSYNLRVGTREGDDDVFCGMADYYTGQRRLPTLGNAQENLSWSITVPDNGIYYWSVQTIDSAYGASGWAKEESVIISSFTDIEAAIDGFYDGKAAWGDYDNDGDLDLAVTGSISASSGISRIYRSDGGTSFVDIGADLLDLHRSSLAWGDYDNDGDLDLVIAGIDSSWVRHIKVYRNDGSDVFTEIAASFGYGLGFSAVDWGDFDNDGDLDLAVAGTKGSGYADARIHRNNGNDTFTDIQAPLMALKVGDLAWGDYDNDGDLDLVLAGMTDDDERFSIIYRNDGDETFTDVGAALVGLSHMSVEWGDYDNDGDLDLAMAGYYWDGASTYVTLIYRNDGTGTFIDIGAELLGLSDSALDWGDFDSDGDLDLVVSGTTEASGRYTKIYRNDGLDTFIDTHEPLPGTAWSMLDWGDFDNDGDLDLALAGSSLTSRPLISRIYRNEIDVPNTPPMAPTDLDAEATGLLMTFSWQSATDDQTPSAGLSYNLRVGTSSGAEDVCCGMADLSTGLRLLPATGNAQKRLSWSLRAPHCGTFYWSVQAVDTAYAGSAWAVEQILEVTLFTDIAVALTGVQYGDLAWGDYDNDGDLDLAIAGYDDTGTRICKVYRNEGGDTFTDIGASLTAVYQCSLAWGDFDNDGDLDLAVSGYTTTGASTKVYRNDGGVFSDIGTGLTSAQRGEVAWGDFNNDGYLDLAITGTDVANQAVTRIHRGDGTGCFADIAAELVEVDRSALAWGDFDNDGDLDLVVVGRDNDSTRTSRIYCNNGDDVFTDINATLEPVEYPAVVWGDYDNDGDLDLALAGLGDSGEVARIYRNDGLNVFTDIAADLAQVRYCSLSWGDCDNDGDLDLALGGHSTGDRLTKVYRNVGADNFEDMQADLMGLYDGALEWGDYDDDGDLDLAVVGYGGVWVAKIYRNDSTVFNLAPGAPQGLSALTDGGTVTVSWDAAADNETPTDGLNYNVRVGTAPQADDVFCGMADTATGQRRVPALGNAQQNLFWSLTALPEGTYYWSVQAVDTAWVGSTWATDENFQIVFEPGDCDGDGDIDLDDYYDLYYCLTGPDQVPPPPTDCGCVDFDDDGDIDLKDFADFQQAFTGS